MKYPTPSPGEGGVFFRYPPHHIETPCSRVTTHAPALPPPWSSRRHRNSDCPLAITDRQPTICRNCPEKYTGRTQREPESVANRRFCFNSPLKATRLSCLLPVPRLRQIIPRARQIIRRHALRASPLDPYRTAAHLLPRAQ